jgi:tetratricopeptide (TPR) repeat protein
MKAAKRKAETKPKETAQQPAARTNWWKPALALAALILTFQIYSPALNGPYVFDDQYLPAVEDSQYAQRSLSAVVRTARPLFNLSFWLTAQVVNDAGPGAHHTVNVWLHFFNAVLMFVVLRRLLESALLAGFGAAVFLLHPVQTESVAYIAGRSESLCLLFFLGAYALFLYRRGDGIGWGAAVGVIALFTLAAASKEHAAVLPALLAATDFYLGGVEAIKKNWRVYAPMLVLGAAGLAMVWKVLTSADTAGFGMRDLPWYQYLFTQWRALWVYLRLFVAPVGLNADYDFPVSRSVMDHGAIFGLIGLLALGAAAFYFRKHFPLVLFGLIVFLLLIAPTSSVVPIRDALAERRLYMPFLGLLLVTGGLLRHWNAPVETRGVAMGVALLALAWLTWGRASLWGSPLALWDDTIRKSPHNSRAHFQRAMLLYTEGRCEEARQGFENANKAGNNEHRLFVDWALALDCLNRPDEAMAKLRQAIAIEDTGHARSLVGMLFAKQGKYPEALAELDKSLRMDASQDMAYVYRGNVYFLQQQREPALADFQRALQLNPANQAAQQGIAALRNQGARP